MMAITKVTRISISSIFMLLVIVTSLSHHSIQHRSIAHADNGHIPQLIGGSVSSKLLYSAPLAGLTTPPMLTSQAPQLTSQWNANSPHWLVAFCILHGLAKP
jgi:hypothetical protein